MKYNNFFNICVEGPDGVGKNTLMKNLVKHYHYQYTIYDRGEISNFIYAKKFGRPFISTQRHVPMLIIGLTCDDKNDLLQRINSRQYADDDEHMIEQEKISDNQLFKDVYKLFQQDFDVEILDTSHKSTEQVLQEAIKIIDKRRISDSSVEGNLTTWSEMYVKACEKYGIKIKITDNQMYLNDIPILVESTVNQNGVYETFSDKRFPDNLLYTLAYDISKIEKYPKEYDFTYVVNTKIKHRPEIFDYYNSFIKNNKTCQISDNPLVKHDEHLIRIPARKYFGEAFLSQMSKAKAAVYCGSDLAYLKLQTARLYEAILTDCIVFVDEQADLDNEILKNIYPDRDDLQELLRCNPNNVCQKYNAVMTDKDLVKFILERQHTYYDNLVHKFEEDLKNDQAFNFSQIS